jgi:uncharacterized membrane protein YeaQ/YmgE (transglycosylase-associated protein family)
MRTNAQQGVLMNIVVGIVGAFLGGFIFNMLGVGGTTINDTAFNLNSLLISFIGAVILLGIINLVRRGQARWSWLPELCRLHCRTMGVLATTAEHGQIHERPLEGDTLNKRINIDQAQERVEALQHEAARLADQARDQLADYARAFDMSKQTKSAKSAVHHGREQLQQAASQASDQVATAMAAALEDAAGRLRTYKGDNPAAQAARNAAGVLEHGSEHLRPWGTRSIARRLTRVVLHNPLPALVVVLCAMGAAYLAKRGRQAVS